jgi:hypothetical protein
MSLGKRKINGIVVLLSIIAIGVVAIGAAVIASLPSIAKTHDLSALLSEITGVVEVQNNLQAPYQPVNNGFLLSSTMQLETKEDSRVRLDLSSGSIVRLGPLTIFSLGSISPASNGILSQIALQAGRIWIVLKGGSLNVTTPAGLASVRGSYMSIWIVPNTTTIRVTCLEGSCEFKDAAGVVDMTTGQKIVISNPNIVPTVEKMDQTDIQSWLDNSPEAVPIVQQVLSLLASPTPSPTPSLTPSKKPVPQPFPSPTATPTPTPTLSAFTFIPNINPYCRSGPDPVFDVIDVALKGHSYLMDGRNLENTWFRIMLTPNRGCWVPSTSGTPSRDTSSLRVLIEPPTPTPSPTPTPKPTLTPTKRCGSDC